MQPQGERIWTEMQSIIEAIVVDIAQWKPVSFDKKRRSWNANFYIPHGICIRLTLWQYDNDDTIKVKQLSGWASKQNYKNPTQTNK